LTGNVEPLKDALEHPLKLFPADLYSHRPAMRALRREIDFVKIPEQSYHFVKF
jgi:hypothetical protein